MSDENQTLAQLGWKTFFNQQLTLENLTHTQPHRVTQVFRNRLVALGESGELNLDLAQYPNLQEATIGDWLLISNNADEIPAIPTILERQSIFQRKSPGANSRQLIAANVDTAFIVSSCNQDFNLSRIERYLALCKEAGAIAVLVLTKTDLVTQNQTDEYMDQLHDLKSHLVILTVNALEPDSCQGLFDWCGVGQTVVLLGSSGVGKTTITNTLCGLQEKTAAIRQDDNKGKHTTTSRSLFFTVSGGLILDCPGMRELQLTDCSQGIKQVFADIEVLARQCKFGNCHHQAEPSCAVQRAIETGYLEQRRLTNYQKILTEQARNSMTLAQVHQKDRKLGKLIKTSIHSKKYRL